MTRHRKFPNFKTTGRRCYRRADTWIAGDMSDGGGKVEMTSGTNKEGAADDKTVSIIVPAYNEALAVDKVIAEVMAVFEHSNTTEFEILLVDDGSTDDTAKNAAVTGAQLIRHPHNLGYGSALKTGIKKARFDTIVILDADGTYATEAIPQMLDRYRNGYDMVVGARSGAHFRGTWIKWPLRIFLRHLVEWAAGREIPDINSGLRIFSKGQALKFESQLCDAFSFTTSLTLAYMMTGKFVHYTPIEYRERAGKSNVSLWRDSLKTLGFILQTILYHSPMKIFMAMVTICLLIAVISVVIGITFKLATGFMMGVGAIIAALIIFSLGLLADLLQQVLGNLRRED